MIDVYVNVNLFGNQAECHRVSQPAWAPRSRGTFLPDSPQAHPCGLGRHPCRSRSESKVPHTLCYVRNHSAMVSMRCNATPASAISRAHLSESTVPNLPTKPRGCGVLFQDRTRQEVMFRMNGMPRAHGCAGAASFKLAQCNVSRDRILR